jgi:hypothetical protein
MTDVVVSEEPITVVVGDDGVTLYVYEGGIQGPAGPVHETYQFSMRGQLEVAVGTMFIPFDSDATFVSLQAVLSVPPSGQSVLIDVLINNISIWANPADRITIPIGADESAIATVFDTDTLVPGDRLSVNVDQIGSINPGQDLVLMVRVLRN